METDQTENKLLSLDEKREKIRSNYETIEVLRRKLEENKREQRLGMTRAAYIKMIYDVTKKVDRQNNDLVKAVMETRRLQRDVAKLEGRLDRSFKLAESIILKNAQTDGWSRECYRLLNVMHENCDQLIQAVQDTGEMTREMRQLEDQIGQTRIHSNATAVAAPGTH